MMMLAITGSIGMGKSTVARLFEKAGIPLFDADAVVRDLQANDPEMIAAIGKRFPDAVRGTVLDRETLARAVLGAPAELQALEAIVHPEVQAARQRFIEDHQDASALLFDIPLLFETGGEEAFDKVIVVSAPAEVQRERVLQRPGMNEAKLNAILARQMPDAQKRERADFVVDTGADLSATEAQVNEILYCLGLR
ncbi:dephospho-CoA kinase [Sphingomonas daechungensis]|uniref:Dephospho-CoA kinase n=1 Tax=Sphingomonas daechungensis TaxID=1176646 RepID=A0ABX6T3C8_9SPHN|nr:dephospho-CoA kinase [Sphingomonas daechungensis]